FRVDCVARHVADRGVHRPRRRIQLVRGGDAAGGLFDHRAGILLPARTRYPTSLVAVYKTARPTFWQLLLKIRAGEHPALSNQPPSLGSCCDGGSLFSSSLLPY